MSGDDLHGGAVGALAEGGTQGRVPVQQVLGGAAQGGAVDRSGQIEHLLDDVDVVPGATGQGVEEEALLQGGEREEFGDVEGVVALDLGQFTGAQGRVRLRRPVPLLDALDGSLGEGLGGAVPEDVAGGQGEPGLAGADEELDGGDAVAADREEVVLGRDRVQPEHLAEQGAEQSFARRSGCASRAQRAVVGGGQRSGVDLAAGGDREGVQRDQGRGDHVVGEPFGGVGAQGTHQRGHVAEGRGAVGVRVSGAGAIQAGTGFVEREYGVEGTVVGRAVPGEGGLVTVAGGEGVEVLRVGAGGGPPAASLQPPQVREIVGEAGVGDAGDPQAWGPLGEQCVQPPCRRPRDLALVGFGRARSGAQHDVVPVAAQLVVMGAPLDPDLGVEPVEGREVVGVQQQFALPAHRLLDGGAQGALVVGGGSPGLDGRAQGGQQPQVADVADEDPPAGGEQPGHGAQDVGEVVGAREVLGHGVEDHRVEEVRGQSGGVVRGLGPQFDPGDVVPGAQRGDRLGGEVGAPVGLAVGRDAGEDQSAADADLQHPPGRAEPTDALDGRLPPLPHLFDGDGESVVHAVPAREVLLGAFRTGRAVEEFVDLLPLLHVGVRAVEGGHDVADEPPVAGPVLAGDDGDLVDGRVAAQHRLDLAGLDPEAADLDLGVGAAEELQASVGPQAHQVAGAVEALAGRAEGVGDEPFGGQVRPAQIAAREARAAEVQLTGESGGDRSQPGVEDVGTGARVGHADRHDRSGRDVRIAPSERGVGGRLGRAVGVEHHPPACVTAHQFRGDPLGARQQGRGGRQSDVVGQGGEQRGRQDHEGDAVRMGVVGERCARHPALGRYDDQTATGEQSEAQVPEGDVEAGRGELEDPAVRSDAEPFALGGDEFRDPAVREDDALGAAGRAGGVDDVGGGVGGHRDVGDGEQGARVGRDGPHPVRPGLGRVGGHDDPDAGVLDHVVEACLRVGRIEGHVRGADPPDGEQGHHQVGLPSQGDTDLLSGPDAGSDELSLIHEV